MKTILASDRVPVEIKPGAIYYDRDGQPMRVLRVLGRKHRDQNWLDDMDEFEREPFDEFEVEAEPTGGPSVEEVERQERMDLLRKVEEATNDDGKAKEHRLFPVVASMSVDPRLMVTSPHQRNLLIVRIPSTYTQAEPRLVTAHAPILQKPLPVVAVRGQWRERGVLQLYTWVLETGREILADDLEAFAPEFDDLWRSIEVKELADWLRRSGLVAVQDVPGPIEWHRVAAAVWRRDSDAPHNVLRGECQGFTIYQHLYGNARAFYVPPALVDDCTRVYWDGLKQQVGEEKARQMVNERLELRKRSGPNSFLGSEDAARIEELGLL